MARTGRFGLMLAIALAAGAAHAADMLTPADLAWLQANLNLAANSPILATLDQAQLARLHGLIDRAHGGAERRRQEVVTFIMSTVGGGFEQTLRDAQRTATSPTELGANAKP